MLLQIDSLRLSVSFRRGFDSAARNRTPVMVIDKAIVFNACINFTKQAEGRIVTESTDLVRSASGTEFGA